MISSPPGDGLRRHFPEVLSEATRLVNEWLSGEWGMG
jgi:hypothetical protein